MKLFADLNPEYPRPQLSRDQWMSLNGWWQFDFDDLNEGIEKGWQDGKGLTKSILVPFPYQSAKSGINSKEIHEVVWYSRVFEIPPDWNFDALLLHFCAVDYSSTVWINGQRIGHNRGGHVPFSFNIAPYLIAGTNRISLRIEDRQDLSQPRGKQSSSGLPVRIYYYCTTGIWQTVWLEPVSSVRIDHLRICTRPTDGLITVDIGLHAPFGKWKIEVDLFENLDDECPLQTVKSLAKAASSNVFFYVENPLLWTPDAPHLYKIRVRLYEEDDLIDAVESYTGIRSFELQNSKFYLNGNYIFLLMILDQGYWPESYLASPSSEDLIDDVRWIKRLGFNGVRKHQKIEDERWLYYCDRQGLLVWEEMPSARTWSTSAEENLLSEWERAIRRDINHPCIVTWVALVESLGFPGLRKIKSEQHAFLERIVTRTRMIDPSRPVIDNDGWEHSELTDICSIHDYTQPSDALTARYQDSQKSGLPPLKGWYKEKPLFIRNAPYRGQPVVLSEVGGFLTALGDFPDQKRDRLFDYYGSSRNSEELLEKYRDLISGISTLTFLAGICYTQLTDIEHESNGLLTYDRTPKVPPEEIFRIHSNLLYLYTAAAQQNGYETFQK